MSLSPQELQRENGELKREIALLRQQVDSLRHLTSAPTRTALTLFRKSGLSVAQLVFFLMTGLAVLYLFSLLTE